jgi:hypothetical protein
VPSSPIVSLVQSSSKAAVSPFIGGDKYAQWNNGTNTYSLTSNGTATASASWSHTVTSTPVKTPTAGAAARGAAQGLLFVVAGFAAWMLL